MGPEVEATEPEQREPSLAASKYDLWEGLCGTIVITTICLLVLHWAGVIG